MGRPSEETNSQPPDFQVTPLPEDSSLPRDSSISKAEAGPNPEHDALSAAPAESKPPVTDEVTGRKDADQPRSWLWQARLETARRGSVAWGFSAFFLGYGGYYLIGFLLGELLSVRQSGFDPMRPPDLGPLLLLSFAPNVLLGILPVAFSWWKGNGPRSDFGIVPTRRDLKVGLACGGIALLCTWVLGVVLISVSGPPPDGGIAELVRGQEGIWLVLFALFAFLGAPLTEELLMRGALWGALEHYRVPRLAILLLTALIFAFIHEEMWRMPVLFVGGVAIGTARMITGRVGSSIVAHATNNFVPAVAIFFL